MKKSKPAMHERDIEARLINWGMCQRGRSGGRMLARETRRTSPYGGQGYKCLTAVVINNMRQAAHGPVGGIATQSTLDFHDAEVINRAWQRLGVEQFKHKLLLRDLYVLGHSPNAICRNLDIKHWPTSHWRRALAEAQAAIEDAADDLEDGNR